ncbi:MAG: 3-dehydroquinate synthase [Bacteroidetes bacterium]|jgi:3-dehydroquinate synthase|nr:3-dehydroquinate synthase [Bacteroidota bacterium]
MANNPHVLINQEAIEKLSQKLTLLHCRGGAVFFLVDDNTKALCLPVLKSLVAIEKLNPIILEIHHGEAHKSLETAAYLWEQITNAGAGRDAMLFTLGGGVISDLGGFVASAYKRGIAVSHIPTTLLAMIDAAFGGKTGIDFMGYKNHIGTFYMPEDVYIITDFLNSLDVQQWLSGVGELLKYGFIARPEFLNYAVLKTNDRTHYDAMIREAAASKLELVNSDPYEHGIRKILNFGHTIGHAFESLALKKGLTFLHGEAVAAGILTELWLSVSYLKLDIEVLNEYKQTYQSLFKPFKFSVDDIAAIIQLIRHDKKNSAEKLNFVLIQEPGKAVFDVAVEPSDIDACLRWYIDLFEANGKS